MAARVDSPVAILRMIGWKEYFCCIVDGLCFNSGIAIVNTVPETRMALVREVTSIVANPHMHRFKNTKRSQGLYSAVIDGEVGVSIYFIFSHLAASLFCQVPFAVQMMIERASLQSGW